MSPMSMSPVSMSPTRMPAMSMRPMTMRCGAMIGTMVMMLVVMRCHGIILPRTRDRGKHSVIARK
jgi:hypothetical protein